MMSIFAENPVIASIFFVALIWMFFFAFKDYMSLKAGVHNDMKSVIVSIGVLGTFIGIFLGLWEFDTSDIHNSVPKLLEGLKLAFSTSIAGMFISIMLSFLQRNAVIGGNDELAVLSEINEKLSGLSATESLIEQVKGIRLENRDEQRKTRETITTSASEIGHSIQEVGATFKDIRIEIHEEQLKARNFLEEQFKLTNDSLKEAIDVLSRGATEEIIKALEQVITDFNDNLTEQFGGNFKQLNEAVLKLVTWQDQFKYIVEKDHNLLIEVRESLKGTSETLALISDRNKEFTAVYAQLSETISQYDKQLNALDGQLESFGEVGGRATTSFEALDSILKTVADGITEQSTAIEALTEDIGKHLPDSLGKLVPTTLNN